MKPQSKIIEWIKRYLPAEIGAIIGVTIGGSLAQFLFHSTAITAIGGTIGENVGFYGKIVYKDIQEREEKDKRMTFLGVLKVIRNAVFEFGLAEYLDLLIRPTAMYFFTKLIGNPAIGLLVGKFAADVTFYTPAIIFYELRKRLLTD
jgi:hypothetical protein